MSVPSKVVAWGQGIFFAFGLSACAPARPEASSSAAPPPAKAALPAAFQQAQPDYASAEGFTRTALAMARQRDSAGGWTTPGTLKLTNARGILVNLERLWGGCETTPKRCAPELENFVVEMLKITMREGSSKATPERVFAVVRPAAYLGGLDSEARSQALFEPLVGDLIVVYVVDEGGALRGAQKRDLAELGMTQAELFATARRNLTTLLPVPEGQPNCRPHAVGAWDSGNYYESSRLLLSEFWRQMAERSKLRVVVAAPAADTLLVACDPTPSELTQLSALVRERERTAARAVSSTLLTWTADGWQPLPR